MAKNLRIVAINEHDKATVSASSFVVPSSNTQRSDRGRFWRSSSGYQHQLFADFNGSVAIGCVAFARHNLPAGSTWKVELLQGEAVVRDSGELPVSIVVPAGIWRAGIDPWGATYNDRLPAGLSLAVHWFEYDHWCTGYRITFNLLKNAAVEVGRVISGSVFSPSDNMDWGLETDWVEPGEHVLMDGGSIRTVGQGELRRSVSFNLSWLNEADRSQLLSLLGRAGKGADLLLSMYPESDSILKELEGMMVCRRDSSLASTHSQNRSWHLPLAFLEI